MLEIKDIKKAYPGGTNAVNGVDLKINSSESFGLVGESGSGKSTLARLICRLEDADTGALKLNGIPYEKSKGKILRDIRKKVQIIFQDSSGSLDPKRTVEETLFEPLNNLGGLSKTEKQKRVHDLMESVGLSSLHLPRYPHQLSGGQRQRVVIARALAMEPEYIVCDEPVSSLDNETQAQILELLKTLQKKRGIGYLFISHDLSVTASVCSDIAVMFAGRIVEMIPAEMVNHAKHPYTRSLFSYVFDLQMCCCTTASPIMGIGAKGCAYAPQCPHVLDVCRQEIPVLSSGTHHRVACHNPAKGDVSC